jgi:hypothetical protein
MSTSSEILNNVYDPNAKGIDVIVQSGTSAYFQYLLMDEQKTDITLTSEVSKDAEVINVSAGHGFTAAAGEHMVIRNGDAFEQTKVISVSTNAITIEMPVALPFPVDGTSIIRGNINMNVDGLATPTAFKYTNPASLGATVPIDITTVVIIMNGAGVPDDGKFGVIPEIGKGMYIRKINGETTNLGNYSTNQEFRRVGAHVEYTTKAPSGTNGVNITFDLENIFDNATRLDPRINDEILIQVRDKIDAAEGMAGMTVAIIGSFTSGE